MKKTFRWIASILLFLSLGLFLFGHLSEVLRRKTAEETDMIHSFYALDHDSLDVLFLGSSHLYYGVQPNVLWRDYGISSYAMSSPEQTAASSYFLLKEAFRFQKPEVVVLESYYLWNKNLYNNESRLRQAFDGMRMSRIKYEMVSTMLPEASFKDKLTYYLPFLKYHSRWTALEPYDFHTKPYLKGARIDYTVEEIEDPGLPKKKAKIPETSLSYVEKIAALCEENGAQFVMLAVPYGVETDMKRYNRRQGMNLTLEKLLKEKEIPFLFYQKELPELIDFSTDFRDKTHLNTAGAEKLTVQLGADLMQLFHLEDHRNDPSYASWNRDLSCYEQDAAALKANPVDTADDAE